VFFICFVSEGGVGQAVVVILQDVVALMYLAASLKLELEMESASGFEMLQTFDDKAAITTRRTTEVWNANGMKSVTISRCNDFVSIYMQTLGTMHPF
jgi:hypothetical protein